MDASPLTPVSAVRASLSGRGPKCLVLAPALAWATSSVGESATRWRPVFLNSRRDVMCCLTVGARGAGNVGLRGGGAHGSPSWCPLHVRTDHRLNTPAPCSAVASYGPARVRRGMRVAGEG